VPLLKAPSMFRTVMERGGILTEGAMYCRHRPLGFLHGALCCFQSRVDTGRDGYKLPVQVAHINLASLAAALISSAMGLKLPSSRRTSF